MDWMDLMDWMDWMDWKDWMDCMVGLAWKDSIRWIGWIRLDGLDWMNCSGLDELDGLGRLEELNSSLYRYNWYIILNFKSTRNLTALVLSHFFTSSDYLPNSNHLFIYLFIEFFTSMIILIQ